MIISKYFGIKIFILFLAKVVQSAFPCNWKSDNDCFLVCPNIHSSNTSEVAYNIEEKWTERPECHAAGISLGLYNRHYHWNATRTVQSHWFKAKVKVNYLEYDTMEINEMEADAFNADAFKSVTKLVFTTMNLRWLTKGLFNGLESLEVLKFKDASQMLSVYCGILDGVNKTLKELTIESNSSYKWHDDNVEVKQVRIFESILDPLWYVKVAEMMANRTTPEPDPLQWYHDREKNKPKRAYQSVEAPNPLEIDAFTGSEQTITLEYVKIRYYLYTLTSKSFVALTNIKHLDLSNCGIESILQGAFDSILTTIEVLRLMNNPFKQLPAGMFELIPLNSNMYIFMGDDVDECECENLPINFIVKVACRQPSVAYKEKDCFSFLPMKPATISLITTSEPTIGSTTDEATDKITSERAITSKPTVISTSSTIDDRSVLPTLERETINLISTIKPSIISTSSTTEEPTGVPTQIEVTGGETIDSSKFLAEPDMEHKMEGQTLSKYTYYIIIGVALVLSLVFFIVWFNLCRERRFSYVSQDDSI